MTEPARPPMPELSSHWCPTCGRQHMPFSGPLPTRHYSGGALCRGQWFPLVYTLTTPVPPAVEEA